MFKSFTIIVLVAGLLLSCCSCSAPSDIHINIFSNISECQEIATAPNATVEVYNSPSQDKNLKGIKYETFFGCNYLSDDFAFELFAYEFSNSTGAMDYFENITGKSNDPPTTFSESSGMTTSRRVVVDENRAYIVLCKNKHKDAVFEFINSCFSVNVFHIEW